MSIDYEKFIRSDYNTTINAVSSSVDSLIFKKINPYQGILEPVQIQDGKYQDPAYTRPRYEGTKSTSAKYIFYTPGDTSYGKTAAIDFNTTKFAWANPTDQRSLDFFDKTILNIKYLIDVTGSLTELSSKNYNWFEVQNTFKKGDSASISLLNKTVPSNQTGLDGPKIVHESGYRYSPIVFRELNEPLTFLYDTPKETSTARLGVKCVSTPSYLFQTVGNVDVDFTDTAHPWAYFKIDGIDQPGTPFSYNRLPITQWPYNNQQPLTTRGPYKRFDGSLFTNTELGLSFSADTNGGNYFYTLDWFTPDKSGSADGGYVTNDSIDTMRVVTSGGQRYAYFEAPRTSEYSVNLNVPIKITYGSNPDPGPSVLKIVAIVEKQTFGTSNWNYVGASTIRATNTPNTSPYGGIGIDEANSSLFLDHTPIGTNRFVEINCIINNLKVPLSKDDKIRIKLYSVEVMNFYWRMESVYFEIGGGDSSRGYFEVYDQIASNLTLDFDQVIKGTDTNYSMFYRINDDTIEFDYTASILYNNSTFFAPTGSDTDPIGYYYSNVDSKFVFEPGDMIRFGSYYSINPQFYYIDQVTTPDIDYSTIPETVRVPLRIKLDRLVNESKVNSRAFAFFKKRKDETCVIVNYKKQEGISSNFLLIPYNLYGPIERDTSNIIRPLRDIIL